MVVNLPDTPMLVMLSSDDDNDEEPKEDPKRDLKEDLEFGEHQVNHGVEDAKLGVSNGSLTQARSLGMSLPQSTIHLGIVRLIQFLTSWLDYFLSPTWI